VVGLVLHQGAGLAGLLLEVHDGSNKDADGGQATDHSTRNGATGILST